MLIKVPALLRGILSMISVSSSLDRRALANDILVPQVAPMSAFDAELPDGPEGERF